MEMGSFPVEIWVEIISKLNHDRHCDFNLQSLSLVCKFFLSITNSLKQTLIISDPTCYFLPSLFHRFPNLKHLSVKNLQFSDLNPILLQIADFHFRLESLNLSRHHSLSNIEALERLPVSTLRSLKSLNISWFSVCHDHLNMIPKLFPNLEDLDLSHCSCEDRFKSASFHEYDEYPQIRYPLFDEDDHEYSHIRKDKIAIDDGIYVLASKLKGLRRINLNGNRWITDRNVEWLYEKCRNLEEVSVKDCESVTQTGINSVLRACKNLKKFGLSRDYRSNVLIDEISNRLCQAMSLSVIDFSKMDVSDAFLFAMAEANLPLKSFSLISCKGFTYDGISSFLTSYDSLDHFALVGFDVVSDENVIILAKSLTELTSVKLNCCPMLSESTLFTLVEQCPLLETVEMKSTNLGKEGFRVGKNALNPRIKTLDLSLNENLGNESLERIALACPNLETLRLEYCVGLSTKGVGKALRKCRSLKHLEIDRCIEVKSLDLDRSTHELEFLSALETGIDDKALIGIAEKCPNLMFLNVSGCKGLTSKGVIVVVEKCDKLKEINLDRCNNMSRKMVSWMIFCKPSLRKVFSPVYICEIDVNMFLRQGCYVSSKFYCS